MWDLRSLVYANRLNLVQEPEDFVIHEAPRGILRFSRFEPGVLPYRAGPGTDSAPCRPRSDSSSRRQGSRNDGAGMRGSGHAEVNSPLVMALGKSRLKEI
jgi:hypothetical protein